jgi:hypothetical protein
VILSIILSACVLVALSVAMHAAGLVALVRALTRWQALLPTRFWPVTWLLIRMTWCLILLHLAEISVWGCYYLWRGCMPDAEAAFYFSGATYATVGYGDLVLAKPWRLLGPIEALTGILMCGLSASFFFAVVNRIYQSRHMKVNLGPKTEMVQI